MLEPGFQRFVSRALRIRGIFQDHALQSSQYSDDYHHNVDQIAIHDTVFDRVCKYGRNHRGSDGSRDVEHHLSKSLEEHQ